MVPLLVWVGFLAIVDGAGLSNRPLTGAPILADAGTQADSGEINVNKRPSFADFNYTTPISFYDIFNDEQNIEDTTDTPFENESSTTKDDTYRDDETDRNINDGFGQSGSGFINDNSYITHAQKRRPYLEEPSSSNADADRESKNVFESKIVVPERNIKRFSEHLGKPNKQPTNTFDDINDDADRITERSNHRFGDAVKSKPNKWTTNTFDESSNEEYPKSHRYAHDEDDKNVNESTEHATERNNKRFGNGFKTKSKKRNVDNSNDDEYSKSDENVDAVNDRKVIDSVDHVTGRNNKQFDNSLQNYSNKKTDYSNDNDSSSQFPKQEISRSNKHLHVHIYNKGTNYSRKKDTSDENISPAIDSQESKDNIPHWEQRSSEESKKNKDDISVKHYKNENNRKPYRISHSEHKIKANSEDKSFKLCKQCHFKYYITSHHYSNNENNPKAHRNYHVTKYDTSRKHHHDVSRTHTRKSHTEPRNNRHGNNYVHKKHARSFGKYHKSKAYDYNHHHDKRTRRKNSNHCYSKSTRNHGYRNHHNRISCRHNKPNSNYRPYRKYKKHKNFESHHKNKGYHFKNRKTYRKPRKYGKKW